MRIAVLRASPQRRFAVKRVGRPRLKPTFFCAPGQSLPGVGSKSSAWPSGSKLWKQDRIRNRHG
ncbi:hypothetical protein X947_3485 [Burkholderia pseudomallei MSHR7334]|nr:hypothetical protein X947_3485 [Burkholderia pseudomallei MSHR7334]